LFGYFFPFGVVLLGGGGCGIAAAAVKGSLPSECYIEILLSK